MKIKALLFLLPLISSMLLSACDNGDNGGSREPQQGSQSGGSISEGGAAGAEGTAFDPTVSFEGTEGSGDMQEEIQTADAGAERIAVAYAEDSTLIGWGLGKSRDSLNRPLDAVNAQEKYGKYSSLFIDLSETNTVYLTFDEGYENGYTADILDTLKAHGVKAVFFVTYDYCKSSPELVERMIAEGHTVGNHSYSHPSFPKCTESEVIEEVTLLHDYVKEKFGYEMTLFRFPMGEYSEKTLAALQKFGYTSVFWSFAYQDWNADSQPSSQEAYNTVTSALHSGGIYLLHAVSKANAASLGDIISFWKQSGYTVGDLEELANNQ